MPYTTNLMSFFFQAEDGIRDYKVTGVQTCALPIFLPKHCLQLRILDARDPGGHESRPLVATFPTGDPGLGDRHLLDPALLHQVQERRVLDLLRLGNQGALDHEQQDDAQEDVAEREPPPAAIAAPGAEVEPLPASLTPVVVGHSFLPPQRGGAPPCSHIAAVSWPP